MLLASLWGLIQPPATAVLSASPTSSGLMPQKIGRVKWILFPQSMSKVELFS